MATPRTSNRRKMNNRGEIGIGTMIVFIASVLVAAIAAGVLIETSGKLQERSQRTGSEATEQVSSNLKIESIVGKRDTATDVGLQDLELYLSLAPGASEFDLAQLRIQLSDGTTFVTLAHDDAAAAANTFNATAVRDADDSFSSAAPVMTSGDLVKISINLDANSAEYEPRNDVSVLMIPEVGAPVETGFVTPNSYGTKVVLALS
jgi:archaeal flagellin FlaB